MRKFLIALSALAGLLCAPVLAQGQAPITVTLKELRSNYKKYDGKVVTVRGQMNNCTGFTCDICEEAMTRESKNGVCLSVDFGDFYEKRENADIAANRTVEEMENAFRFATVTITALFDGRFLSGEVCCSDKPWMLTAARVQWVHSRKTASNGLFDSFYDYGPLATPAPEDREAMVAELRSHMPEDFASFEMTAFRVEDKDGLKDTGLGCVCRFESGGCAGKWPDRYFGGFKSPANPFVCYDMQKRNGVWRLLVSLE